MNYKNLTREERDRLLKQELDPRIVKILEKFDLTSSQDLYWISEKENTLAHKVYKHSYLKRNSLISVLFRAHGLCFAKVHYFEEHIDHFEPYYYDFKNGFVKTELWNADFFKHKESGHFIDLRQLSRVTKIEDFIKLYEYLESFEKK